MTAQRYITLGNRPSKYLTGRQTDRQDKAQSDKREAAKEEICTKDNKQEKTKKLDCTTNDVNHIHEKKLLNSGHINSNNESFFTVTDAKTEK